MGTPFDRRRLRDVEQVKPTIETPTPVGEATRIHVVREVDDGSTTVWLDTDVGTYDGICIGVGATREAALDDAINELHARIFDLEVVKAQRS